MLGHSDLATTARYLHLSDQYAADTLAAIYPGGDDHSDNGDAPNPLAA